jgi:hypothetical protein
MPAKLRNVWFASLLIVFALASGSCVADTLALSSEQAATLEQRVRARWQALTARDYAGAWSYESPVYRKAFPPELYVLQFSYEVQRELTEVEIVNYDAAAAVASVAVRVMSTPTKRTSSASQAIGAVPVTIHERWISIDGEWWHSANI